MDLLSGPPGPISHRSQLSSSHERRYIRVKSASKPRAHNKCIRVMSAFALRAHLSHEHIIVMSTSESRAHQSHGHIQASSAFESPAHPSHEHIIVTSVSESRAHLSHERTLERIQWLIGAAMRVLADVPSICVKQGRRVLRRRRAPLEGSARLAPPPPGPVRPTRRVSGVPPGCGWMSIRCPVMGRCSKRPWSNKRDVVTLLRRPSLGQDPMLAEDS